MVGFLQIVIYWLLEVLVILNYIKLVVERLVSINLKMPKLLLVVI